MKTLITGGKGLVGSRFLELNFGMQSLTPGSDELDITNSAKTQSWLSNHKPDLIIHFAAFTSTEKAQEDNKTAWMVNVEGTKNLVSYCQKNSAKIVYISTDHTFDGVRGNFREDDVQNPVNYYGLTKLEAEKVVIRAKLNHLIIRLSYPYRAEFEGKTDCVRWILPKLKEGQSVSLVYDQYITPTFVDEFVQALRTLIEKQAEGVYHLAGSQCLNFWEIGNIIAETWGLDKGLLGGITLEEFRRASVKGAPAPRNSCLNCEKVKKDFGIVLSDFKTGMRQVKKQLEVT